MHGTESISGWIAAGLLAAILVFLILIWRNGAMTTDTTLLIYDLFKKKFGVSSTPAP